MSENKSEQPGPREIDHGSVDSLLGALVACSSTARAYRGHGDSNWHLEPSVVRNHRYQYRKRRSGLHGKEDSASLENHFLKLFVSACDKAGLRVSGDGEKLRNFLDDPNAVNPRGAKADSGANQWPGDSNEMLSLMAQAQHYGVPTRLLDWTTAPLIAAYFGASSALQEWAKQPDQRLLARKFTVWELDIEESKNYRRKFEIKRAPGSVSAYLPAQRGIFTLMKGALIPSLRLEDHPHSARFLSKHNLSIRHIPQLMCECDRHGHSAATLFPGYEGSARHAEELFLISELKDALADAGQSPTPT